MCYSEGRADYGTGAQWGLRSEGQSRGFCASSMVNICACERCRGMRSIFRHGRQVRRHERRLLYTVSGMTVPANRLPTILPPLTGGLAGIDADVLGALIDGNILTIKVDLAKEFGPSSSRSARHLHCGQNAGQCRCLCPRWS